MLLFCVLAFLNRVIPRKSGGWPLGPTELLDQYSSAGPYGFGEQGLLGYLVPREYS